MTSRLTHHRLIALFGLGWLLLNFPLLGLWDVPVRIARLPLFPLAIFAVWLLLIVLLAWLMEGSHAGTKDD